MLSLLDDDDARAMIAEARRFGMDALVEVHDEAEMRRALGAWRELIGINNRDLRDLSHRPVNDRAAGADCCRTACSCRNPALPAGRTSSGCPGKVDGFLVGTSLMRAADPGQAARALVFGRVKLCG